MESTTAYVNLWELITWCRNHKESSRHEECENIQRICQRYPSFGTELDLQVRENQWTIRVFHHNDSTRACVELVVSGDGTVSIRRNREIADLYEERAVTF